MKDLFQPAVYLLASKPNGTLYIGVTSNLVQRIYQHREGLIEGFTKQYDVKILVWYELHATMEFAIAKEKAILADQPRGFGAVTLFARRGFSYADENGAS